MPCLNEELGLRTLLPQIVPLNLHQILVLDGGSKDRSLETAQEFSCQVYVQRQRGLRLAYQEIFPLITGDIVITFSPDGNSLVDAIPRLIEKMQGGYDLVIGSRYLHEARSDDDTWLTRAGNWAFTFAISRFGFPYTDAMVMLRAYRREVAQRLWLTSTRSVFYERWIGRYVSWEPLMSIRAAKARMKIAEIPASEPARLDEEGRMVLPTSRISHFKAGFACGILVLEEIFSNWCFNESELTANGEEGRDGERESDRRFARRFRNRSDGV